MQVPGYHATSRVGGGGFSEVYRATRTADGIEMILKVLTDPDDLRLEGEVAALRAVGPPTAPALADVITLEDGRVCLALELIGGQPLSAERPRHPLDALPMLAAAARTIDAIGAAGFVHRDIKPAHLIHRADGTVTAIDFGIAVAVEAPVTGPRGARITAHGAVGTVAYMAPEQLRGEAATAAVDRYAFAVLAFEILAGEPLFGGAQAAIRNGHLTVRPRALSSVAPVSPAVDDVFAKMLAKRPGDRFESAAEFAHALTAAVAVGGKAAPVAPTSENREIEVALIAFRPRGQERLITEAIRGVGVLAVAEHDLVIGAFPGAKNRSAGVRAALMVARRLEAGNSIEGGAFIRLAQVRTRERRGALRVSGRALLERGWLPSIESGVVLSEAAAAALPPTETAPADSGFRLVRSLTTDSMDEPSLHGHADRLASLAEALATECPLITVIAGPGHGKTRFGDAAAELARDHGEVWSVTASVGQAQPLMLADRIAGLSGESSRSKGYDREPGARGRLEAAEQLAATLRRGVRDRRLTLVLDDAHLAESSVLDAIELATMESDSRQLTVIVLANPSLRHLRPSWGHRAPRHLELELEPLPPPVAAMLVRELLGPVEFIADDVVSALVAKSAGVPLHIVELIRGLYAAGFVRQSEGGQSAYLETDGLFDSLAALAGDPLAAGALAGLSADLSDFARLCAIIEAPLEADWLDRNGSGETSIDARVGLGRLLERGLLTSAAGFLRFRHPIVRESIAAAVDPDRQARIHQRALANLPSGDTTDAGLAQLARHARGAGERTLARATYRELADRFQARHAFVESEALFSAALDQHSESDGDRLELLARRAASRTKLSRFPAALADVRASIEIAAAAKDDAALIDLAVEESTILDWMLDSAGAAKAVERAVKLAEGTPTPNPARLALARGRVCFRFDQPAEAVEWLTLAVSQAESDYETEIGARALLGIALLFAGRADDSRAAFERALAVATSAGDMLHEAVVLSNRLTLWEHLNERDAAQTDLRRAVSIAKRLGNVQVEWCALHNLAETLHFAGRDIDALPLAERARQLQLRFDNGPEFPDNSILVARIAFAIGDLERAGREAAGVRSRCPSSGLTAAAQLFASAIELATTEASSAAWLELEPTASDLGLPACRLEFYLIALAAARRRGDEGAAKQWIAKAAPLAVEFPIWRQLLERT